MFNTAVARWLSKQLAEPKLDGETGRVVLKGRVVAAELSWLEGLFGFLSGLSCGL